MIKGKLSEGSSHSSEELVEDTPKNPNTCSEGEAFTLCCSMKLEREI